MGSRILVTLYEIPIVNHINKGQMYLRKSISLVGISFSCMMQLLWEDAAIFNEISISLKVRCSCVPVI